MAARGQFVVLDGIDGCGKSTQAARLARWLREAHGREVATLRDPGTTAIGEAIRELLLGARGTGMAPGAEWLLYVAARAQLVHERVAPALAAGHTVVCDRFTLATLAYQGHALGAPLHAIRAAAAAVTAGAQPDLQLVLDLAPEVGLQRTGRAPDRIEARGVEYLARVRAGFLAEARDDARIVVIDASRDPEAVWLDVRAAVAARLALTP